MTQKNKKSGKKRKTFKTTNQKKKSVTLDFFSCQVDAIRMFAF